MTRTITALAISAGLLSGLAESQIETTETQIGTTWKTATFTASAGVLADGQATRIFWNEQDTSCNDTPSLICAPPIVIQQPDRSKFTAVEHGYYYFDAIVEFDAQGFYGSFNLGVKYLTLYLKRSGYLAGVLYVRAMSEGAKPTYMRLPQNRYGYHLNAGDEIYLTLYAAYGYSGSMSTYSAPRLRITYRGHD